MHANREHTPPAVVVLADHPPVFRKSDVLSLHCNDAVPVGKHRDFFNRSNVHV